MMSLYENEKQNCNKNSVNYTTLFSITIFSTIHVQECTSYKDPRIVHQTSLYRRSLTVITDQIKRRCSRAAEARPVQRAPTPRRNGHHGLYPEPRPGSRRARRLQPCGKRVGKGPLSTKTPLLSSSRRTRARKPRVFCTKEGQRRRHNCRGLKNTTLVGTSSAFRAPLPLQGRPRLALPPQRRKKDGRARGQQHACGGSLLQPQSPHNHPRSPASAPRLSVAGGRQLRGEDRR